VYEFQVSGLLGPVLRAALPELTVSTAAASTIITGGPAEPTEIAALVGRFHEWGVVVIDVRIGPGGGRQVDVS
jgi:hypothetical protein